MNSTAGADLTGPALLGSTAILATGLVWLSAALIRAHHHAAQRAACHAAAPQCELRREVAELSHRVGGLQRLLEGVD